MSEPNSFSDVSESASQARVPGPKLGIWGILIFVELATLLVVLIAFWVWTAHRVVPAGPRAGDANVLKAAAKELEDRGLAAAAAAAWQAYLELDPEASDRLAVLLRIGQLRIQAEQYAEAAEAFALAYQQSQGQPDIQKQAETGLETCQRLTGLYGPIEKWLAQRRRQSSEKPPEGQVVAIIGNEKLTEADLDGLLRNRLDHLLAAQGLSADKARRDAELRQWNSPIMRARLLQALIQNDLFLRRARELKLHEDPEFVAAREETLETLLLRRFVEQEVQYAPPTPAEIEAYYRTHQAEFQQPEMLHLLLMHFTDAKVAAETASKIQSAEQFRQIATHLRTDNGQPASGMHQIFRGRTDSLLGDTESLFQLQEGQWTTTPLQVGNNYFLVLVDKKVPARSATLAEVQRFIEQKLLEQRRQEALDRLFEQLAQRYGVKLLLQAPSTSAELPVETDQTLTEKGPAKSSPTPPVVPSPGPTETPPAKLPSPPPPGDRSGSPSSPLPP